MADTLRGEILDNFCAHRDYLLPLVGLIGVFLLLTTIGFTIIEPGTATHMLNTMNFVALGFLFVVFGALTRYCFKRDRSFQ